MRDGIMKKGLIYSNDKQQNFCNDVIATTKIQTDINCQNRKYHKMLVYMLINFRMVFVLFFSYFIYSSPSTRLQFGVSGLMRLN